ncbi:protachykinin-like isoform X2 [Oncorhynchus masou masou]|uniref:protachykinin-like isoform X2 n=1 Tax=Oncorhynchus masou masou TaxID=90313 RepID=UPI003182D68B
MKLLLPLVIAFLAIAQVFCEDIGPKEDLDYWMNDKITDEWLSSDPFGEILRRMTRKPRPHQFFGLMGKRSSGHKINSFVGLMGKRSQEKPDSYEWNALQNYDKRR